MGRKSKFSNIWFCSVLRTLMLQGNARHNVRQYSTALHEVWRRVDDSEWSWAFWIVNSVLPLDSVGAVFDWRWCAGGRTNKGRTCVMELEVRLGQRNGSWKANAKIHHRGCVLACDLGFCLRCCRKHLFPTPFLILLSWRSSENTQPLLPAKRWNLHTAVLGDREITEEEERFC